MATAKKNKDGLIGGELVSPKDHARILREKQKAKLKAEQEKREAELAESKAE